MIIFKRNLKAQRRIVAFLSALSLIALTGLAAIGSLSLGKLGTHYSMRQFLPERHELLEREDRLKALYQVEERPPILVLLDLGPKEPGTWLEPARIGKLRSSTEKMGELESVADVMSIATVSGATNTTEGIDVGPLLENTPPAEWLDRVRTDPLLTPQLVSADGRTVIIVLEKGDLSAFTIKGITQAVRAEFSSQFPESRVQIGGVPVIQADMTALLTSELMNLCGFALIAMIFALLMVFRNFSSVIIPLYITALANVCVLSGMAVMGVAFTILSTTLPILVSVTVVSMVTHTMLRFAKEWNAATREPLSKAKTVYKTMHALFLPNLLTSLTTCVGFAALMTTKIPLITQYGGAVAAGVMTSWLCTMIALPAALILFPVPKPRNWTQSSALWSLYIMQNRKPIFLSLLASMVLMTGLGWNQNWNAILFDDMPKGHEARSSTVRIDEQLGGMIPLDIVVHANKDQAWNSPALVSQIDKYVSKWRKDPRVGSVVGVPDFIRAAQNIENKGLPETRQAVAEIYFLYSMSNTRPLDHYLTGNSKSTRISFRLHDVPADQMAALVLSAKSGAEEIFPNYKVEATNMATTVHSLNHELSLKLINGFWEALLLIAVLLVIIFRSFRWTLIAIVPNLFPPLALLACMSTFNTSIEPGIAIIFSIALGLAFNNTVYLLGRLRSLHTNGRYASAPIQRALYLEGVPCILSTVSLVAGFTVFLVSYFQLNQLFGAYMLVSIFAGLIGDLFFLPTLIQMFPNIVPAVKVKSKLETSTVKPNEEADMSPVVAASVALLLMFNPVPTEAKKRSYSAKRIMKRVDRNMSARDESATVNMKIVERNGTTKDRELTIQRKNKKARKSVMVRLIAPGDIRGTGLLSVEKSGVKNQWLYLPSSKKTRRVLSKKQGGNFLGSELSYEDMGGSAGVKYRSRVLRIEGKRGRKVAVIESRPRKGESAYSKIVSWIPLNKYVVYKAKYYDKKGKLLKIASFKNYKRFGKRTWRATRMTIKNVQNKRSTVMLLKGLRVNRGIDDDIFSVASLEDEE